MCVQKVDEIVIFYFYNVYDFEEEKKRKRKENIFDLRKRRRKGECP